MTNVIAAVTILLTTNRQDLLLPSGEEKIVTTIVQEHHVIEYSVNGQRFSATNLCCATTNVARFRWSEVPLRSEKKAFGITDMPPIPK